MKIQGQRPNVETTASQRLEAGKEPGRGERGGRAARGADRFDLSPEASLASEALKAADQTPAIRQDKVERARQQLAAGEIGRDAGQLADRLIDHLLSE